MSEINSTAIGIGLGLGVPWCLCMTYILRQWLCPDSCIIRKTKYNLPPAKIYVKDLLTKESYLDFLQGKISIALRNELIMISTKHKDKIKDFIQLAKEIHKPHMIPFIKDPLNYPLLFV